MNSLSSRIIGTIVAFFGWLAFVVLYLAFFAGGLDFWQKFAVFLASGAIVVCIIAVVWIRWTFK
jgi:phosphate starvation-inducible membrane PsiE